MSMVCFFDCNQDGAENEQVQPGALTDSLNQACNQLTREITSISGVVELDTYEMTERFGDDHDAVLTLLRERDFQVTPWKEAPEMLHIIVNMLGGEVTEGFTISVGMPQNFYLHEPGDAMHFELFLLKVLGAKLNAPYLGLMMKAEAKRRGYEVEHGVVYQGGREFDGMNFVPGKSQE